ncbi:sporulation transcription factor Spo0A [Christensenellaceae bacterium NSJ-53]|uniref:Stage 0 sporulation protein A homolog n=1 Tax=Gehongia tenuis TaxID=2763655 RepID=A0A926D3I9_9FIRM|nr:sporulation transcription factor Spo0A [Gehongia tenuis]
MQYKIQTQFEKEDSRVEKVKVVVVDDNREIRGIIKQYLDSQNDVEVVGVAGDGMQALELLNQVEADVMVLDIIMPELDGFGVLERMSSCTGKRPDVIMLTALGQEDLVRKAINLGAKYYMVKPLDLGVLTQRVVELGRMKNQTVLSVPPIAAAAPQPARSLEEKITSIFLTIGIPAHIKGYHYLRYAVKLAVENNDIISRITKELYPSIAKHFDTTPSKVERAIRHAIEVAWNRGKIENINQLFGFHVYTKSDKPTNGEFIALVADKLIMEKSA